MEDSNYGKKYNCFAEHPLAPIYFKYIDILKSDKGALIAKNLNHDVQHLLEIAYAPITHENMEIISSIVASMQMLVKDDYNEFTELDEQMENAS